MRWRLLVFGSWIAFAVIGYKVSQHFHNADSCLATRALPPQHRLRAADLDCDMPDRLSELTGLYLKTAINNQSKVTRAQLSVAPDLTPPAGASVLAVSIAGREDLARQLDVASTVFVTDGSITSPALPVIALSCSDRSDSKCAAMIAVPAALQGTLKDASKLTVVGVGK
jgi:hypothetical protein